MDDLDGLHDTVQLQSALRGDFEIVADYGEEHPGAWAGAWWDNEPTVRIVAAFTGDAASHDAALRPRLRHPDRLGRTIDLAPGESASIPIIFGTASTREDLGYVVPPGRYWLQVQMRLQHGCGDPQTNAPAAPLTQITVIPRDPELRADQASAIEDKRADHPI